MTTRRQFLAGLTASMACLAVGKLPPVHGEPKELCCAIRFSGHKGNLQQNISLAKALCVEYIDHWRDLGQIGPGDHITEVEFHDAPFDLGREHGVAMVVHLNSNERGAHS